MVTTIKRWGNSSAVRIPRAVLTKASVEEGMDMEVLSVNNGEILLRVIRKRKSIQELFADYDGGYLKTDEMDWGAPEGEEIW